MNSSTSVCPKCGTVSVLTATKGVCPRCLFEQLEDPLAPEGGESEAGSANAGETSTERSSESEFGDYELFEEIGQGGMGVVYRARQVSLNRPVAVKVIKLGMDTRKIIARFEAERQALALMDHPAIARVFDAGATRTGRPYFVMELVRGLKITDYCKQHPLSTNQRLDLFIQVCQAVQHAHQKGIIHRDLKPSNILVAELDGRPLPKIIDFGIAKATEGRSTEETLFTVAGQFIGTPAYLSPEQAEWGGVDIDTRSDIYSLGVLLYELLTGCLPFEPKTLAKASLDEMRRTIREITPVRPSTRLRQTGVDSSSDFSLAPRPSSLAVDLDWIVMKCLEKERGRRYETANGLAQDLQRHLHNEPVLARPPSRIYEFQKTVRRHKIGFAATAVVILALAAGVLVSSWQARRASQAEHQARRRAYLADMRTLGESLDSNLARARHLLEEYRSDPGEEDLRGFEWYYFKHYLLTDESKILGTHPGGAMTLLTRPDGTFITAGRTNDWSAARGHIQIWDGVRQKLVNNLTAPTNATGIALSQDGKWLALMRGVDIELRNMDQPDQVQRVLTNWHQGFSYTGWTKFICFFNHDTELAVADWVPAWKTSTWLPLKFVNIATDTASQPLPTGRTTIFGMAVSQDGLKLAIRDTPDRILIYDVTQGKVVSSLETQVSGAYGVYPPMLFLRDSRHLITTLLGQISLWDITTSNRVRVIGDHYGTVSALSLSPDEKRLASVGLDQLVKVWDPDREAGRTPLRVLRGHTNQIFGVGFMPDGHTLVSCGRDETVRHWDLNKPALEPAGQRWRLPPGQKGAAILPGVLGATDNKKGLSRVKVWDISGFSHSAVPRPIPSPPPIAGAVVVPLLGTGYHLVSVKPDEFHPRTYLYRGLDPPEPVRGFPEIRNCNANSIRLNDHLLMLYARIPKKWSALVWDLTHQRVVHQVKSMSGSPEGVAFASDGSCVILSRAGGVKRLDLTTGVSDVWHDATPGMRTLVALLPDNRTVFATGGLGVLRKLDFPTRRITAEVIASPTAIRSLCLSPSGTRLATGDDNGTVKLWDVQTLREIVELGRHPGEVTGLWFTPDGRTLLSTDTTELRAWCTADRGSPK